MLITQEIAEIVGIVGARIMIFSIETSLRMIEL
jgi:hypothetical protein